MPPRRSGSGVATREVADISEGNEQELEPTASQPPSERHEEGNGLLGDQRTGDVIHRHRPAETAIRTAVDTTTRSIDKRGTMATGTETRIMKIRAAPM